MKIYRGQTALKITFKLYANITGYSAVVVNVRKPDQSITTWPCIVSDVIRGWLECSNFLVTTLDLMGRYYCQSQITFSDGTTALSETVQIMVYEFYD